MKAITLTKYGSPDYLQYTDVAKPTPNGDQVLIKVKAASVNDWDWGMVIGKPFYIRLLCGLRQPKIRIPGVDIAGQVEAVGKDITRFKPGDEVYGDLSEAGFGGFAEYVCAPESALAFKPRNISFQDAAAIPHAGMLALQGLRDAGELQSGQKLLINGGGGGVGTLGVQIAAANGVTDSTGVDSGEKLYMMQSLGFKHTIDYRQEDFTAKQERYDLILDPKTNRSVFRYLHALNPKGRYVTVGGDSARLLQILFLSPLIKLLTGKTVKILALKPNEGLDNMNKLLESGKVRSVTDGPYNLSEAAEAIRLFGEGRHKGKIIITIENDG